MLCRFSLAVLLFVLVSPFARAACDPIQIAYPDLHRPPYWLGNGAAVANPPGAGVELVQAFGASVGCPVALKRLPVLRMRPALAAGEVDFTPVDAGADKLPGIVLPHDRNGHLDVDRSSTIMIVVFVRTEDGLDRNLDSVAYFRGKLLGVTLGSPYEGRLRQAGYNIDSGATDVARNFEKLRLHRIDGFAVSLISPSDMDSYLVRYGGQFTRLEQPLFADHVWLGASQAYYNQHRDQVETMWTWLGGSGRKEFARLLKKYAELPSR